MEEVKVYYLRDISFYSSVDNAYLITDRKTPSSFALLASMKPGHVWRQVYVLGNR